ncbi:MAG: DNA-3-methyladenine glycosylase [Candidatus Omnitrophica bacterium]|nr:DNA-3-methyladenine glycosylase [Candidatus Omnitrophota bacterium]
MKPLREAFYRRNTAVVAFELIGKTLLFERDGIVLSGRIVETEAYFGADDPASHAYRGVTPRNEVMFGRAGRSYVYFTYGNHHCLNIVTEEEGVAGAVLIRSLEPLRGISEMQKRRKRMHIHELASGPGKVTEALGITREHSGWNLTEKPFYVTEPEGAREEWLHIRATSRIGISRAKTVPFRFYVQGNSCVSKR